jgi:hypothetical protein
VILAAVLCATLTSDGYRPIADLAEQLEKQYPIVITYEEAGYAAQDIEEIRPDDVSVRVPRKAPMTFRYDARAPYKDMLEQLVKQAHDAGAPGAFRVEGHDAIFHIVPARESVLSTPVTLEDEERTVDATLDEILPQLPYSVGWGFVPLNLFAQTKVRIAAKSEPAREVFRRIIEQVAAQKPYRVTWRLNHDPFMDRYILNFVITAARP